MTNEKEELKPCPFCGRQPTELNSVLGYEIKLVCHCSSKYRESNSWSIQRWNNAYCWQELTKKDEMIKVAEVALGEILQVGLDPDLGQIVESEHYEGAWIDCVDIACEALEKLRQMREGK